MPRNDSRISRSSSTTRTLDILCLRGGRHLFSQRKFDNELGPGRLVLFYTNGTMMVFDDTAHDGQSQASTPLLGGEIRKEELFFYLPIDAGACICYGNLQSVLAVHQCRGYVDLAHQ